MKTITTGVLLAGAAALLTVTNVKAETVMKFSSWAPPTHPQNSQVFPLWGKRIEAATQGRVKWKIEYKLASPPKQFEVSRDGIADASWIFHGYNTRYLATQAVEIPGLGGTAETASYATQKAFDSHLHKANEHRGVAVAAMFSHGDAVIHTKKQIRSLADLKGMKIRVPGGVGSLVGKQLGVVAVKAPAPKVYEILSSGVADGVFMPVEVQKTFRLKEVVPHVTFMPGGLYYGSFAVLISPAFLNKLSAQDRKAVLSTTGTSLSRAIGKIWEQGDVVGLADAKKFGSKIQTAGSAMLSEYKGITAKVEANWLSKMAKKYKNVDAKAALAEVRAAVASYK